MADVIKMLEQDHREAEALFAKIKETNGAARAGLVTKLADALKLHMEVEEKIVYPAISKQVTGGTEMVEEAQTEHQGARKVLGDVEKLSPNEPGFDGALGDARGRDLPPRQRRRGRGVPDVPQVGGRHRARPARRAGRCREGCGPPA